MSDTNYVKKETFEQMRVELHQMKSVERPAASRAASRSRSRVCATVCRRHSSDGECD
jgi:transcription elongation factor GreA